MKTGLYEKVVNKEIQEELDENQHNQYFRHDIRDIDKAEASSILAQYLHQVLEKALSRVEGRSSDKRLENQVNLTNKIVDLLSKEVDEDFSSSIVDEKAKELLAVIDTRNTEYEFNEKKRIERPETSISKSSLFTGSNNEPQMYTELKKEIPFSDRIDMLVSFIKWSGLRLLMDSLKAFTQKGGKLRVITTSYMGATDAKAIEELSKLENTEIRISYDTKMTRLHAKSYIFYRDTGFTTAYVGSSNMSNAALSSGLEWNVKVTRQDLPETIQKITATFESYWNAKEFVLYDSSQLIELEKALKQEKYTGGVKINYSLDYNPYPYQQEVLDELSAERELNGSYRNLIVAATGTGKTIIAALDYRRQIKDGHYPRLLFIAHREEILKQSIETFRQVLKDSQFGDLMVGTHRPEDSINYLFMSIQTFNSQHFAEKVDPEFYEYVVIDETHHSSASSYQGLLDYFNPKILLGLTATPERMDGNSILPYFDGHIASEIRLPEAIERKLLCPFQYFGVRDDVDLSSIRWTRGGYDVNQLDNLYVENAKIARERAQWIVESVGRYVTDIDQVKGLGFCVSIKHAEFMADYFNERGIPSVCLVGQTKSEVRHSAQNELVKGEKKFIFVVDLYNEGVDIPEVNTILFLRPTQSLTIFLQQLGRGLRLSDNKECLTVLDFIAQSNTKYNFEEKFAALLTNTQRSIVEEINKDFPDLPKGCYIELEKKPKKIIIDNVRQSFMTNNGIIKKIKSFEEDTGKELTLENFLDHYHLDIGKVYRENNNLSFSDLKVAAHVMASFDDTNKNELAKGLKRVCSIDSRRWIHFLLKYLPAIQDYQMQDFNDIQLKWLQMFVFTFWRDPYDKGDMIRDPVSKLQIFKNNPVILEEVCDILEYKLKHIDFVARPLKTDYESALDVYCTYTHDQLFAGLGVEQPSNVREGVRYLPDIKSDVFTITLNKSDKDYSPTTMYNDYSISETLFHWQSQSTTADTSTTGQRYINHKKDGSHILLFVRENNKNISGTSPYTFLGTAHYISHEGSKPMNIIWELDDPIPAKFLKRTNKLLS